MKKQLCVVLQVVFLCMMTIFLILCGKERIVAASVGYETCSDCYGSGKVTCTDCNGKGYWTKKTEVSEGSVFVPQEDGTTIKYDFKSNITYKPCTTCGGAADSYTANPLWKVYYSDTNFSTVVYSYYSVSYVAGSGYIGTCTTCEGKKELPIVYEIKYNGNGNTGGYMENSTHIYDTGQVLNSNTFTRIGYTFLGWSTSACGTTDTGMDVVVSYTDKQSVQNLTTQQKDVVNLYAIWKRNQYPLTYHANGGIISEDVTTKDVYYGDNIDLSVSCTKEGYIFLGWALADSKVCLSSYTMPAENLTLYACYSIPVSDVKEACILSYNSSQPSIYNLYQLQEQSETINGYLYTLNGKNLLYGLKRTEDLEVWLLLYDHAGNRNEIPIKTPIGTGSHDPENIPVPSMYLQTVEHYLWNRQIQKYQYYRSVSELVYEGERYTPSYFPKESEIYPMGYEPEMVDDSYIVSGMTTTKAYYKPTAYTVFFDSNGGICDIDSKTVYIGDIYGELPIPVRTGYDFAGWYMDKQYEEKVSDTDVYTITGDSTLYASWEIHRHNVVYDYKTNGGSSVEREIDTVAYGEIVDMTVKAFKEGWEFCGWNTNPEATEGFESCTMQEEDILLYAIYKKEITVRFIDIKDTKITERKEIQTIYNKEIQTSIVVPEQNETSGWENLGWSFDTEADAAIHASCGSILKLTTDAILYGCYLQNITLSYDTNGSSEMIESQTKQRYWNASGIYKNPQFVLADAPHLDKNSFVKWKESESDKMYQTGEDIELEESKMLIATWDRFPEIEAYDRYFPLEEAQNGEITQAALLEKVIATDKEDGILVNGSNVIVKEYHVETFTNIKTDTVITVCYEARDSFGNCVEKKVTVYVIDTLVKINPVVKYARFISKDFYLKDEKFVSTEDGGIEDTSIWRVNKEYQALLLKTLQNEKKNVLKKTITFFHIATEIADVASGQWESEKETWVFTYEDMKKMSTFTENYGFGNIKTENGTKLFLDWFDTCRR